MGTAGQIARLSGFAERHGRIPSDTEILVTHGPREGVLDMTVGEVGAGCGELRERVERLRRVRLHVFGHVHESRGVHLEAGTGLVSVNCAMVGVQNGQAAIIDVVIRG